MTVPQLDPAPAADLLFQVQLGPHLTLGVDAATCIVLRCPDGQHTITNVEDMIEQLRVVRTFARAYAEGQEDRPVPEKNSVDGIVLRSAVA